MLCMLHMQMTMHLLREGGNWLATESTSYQARSLIVRVVKSSLLSPPPPPLSSHHKYVERESWLVGWRTFSKYFMYPRGYWSVKAEMKW